VTPATPLPLPPPSLTPAASPVDPVAEVRGADGLPEERSAEETRAAGDDDPVPGADPTDVAPGSGTATLLFGVPPEDEGVCGAAVCEAGVPPPFGDTVVGGWLTGVVAAVVGVVVLFVSDFTTAAGVVVVVDSDWSTESDGTEPPLPPGGTVVAGADATVVFVVGVVA